MAVRRVINPVSIRGRWILHDDAVWVKREDIMEMLEKFRAAIDKESLTTDEVEMIEVVIDNQLDTVNKMRPS